MALVGDQCAGTDLIETMLDLSSEREKGKKEVGCRTEKASLKMSLR